MNLSVIFIFILFDFSSTTKTTQVTLGVHDRIVLLKRQLVNQIKSKRPQNDNPPEDIEVLNENLEYEDHENEPITPINEKDPRKKKDKFKLKQIKTTRDLGQNFKSRNDKAVMLKRNQKPIGNVRNSKAINKKPHVVKSKITDVFYRRMYPNDISNSAWTHCQDMITPFLTGHKTNMTYAKRVAYDDPVVIRLIQLLTEDITDHTKDDIHSILYQISNLQLRLFQWDVAAIKLLLNVLNRDKLTTRHSFRTIKNGLKAIFKTWNLSFGTNIEALLKQTRIFRPPCIKITDNEGSTKTSKTVRYTKSVKPKKQCSTGADGDYDGECGTWIKT